MATVSDVTNGPNGPNCPTGPANAAQPTKIHYTYDQLHTLIDQKAREIKENEEFDYIVAIGGGGLIPARMIRRILNVPILVLTLKYYDAEDQIGSEPEIIQWDPSTIEKMRNKRCLIVDEVFDTGSTMEYVVNRLIESGVSDLSVLVLHHKKKLSNLSKMLGIKTQVRNYYSIVEVSDEWVVYPWEADDIREHNRMSDNS